LQEGDQISAREEQRHGEDSSCRWGADSLTEGVEAGRWKNETADIGHIRQAKNCQRDGSLPTLLRSIQYNGLLEWCLCFGSVDWCAVGVLVEILVVEGAEVVGVFGLVLLDIGLVNPEQRVHEPESVVSVVRGLVGVE
jgi:hypothetical protein